MILVKTLEENIFVNFAKEKQNFNKEKTEMRENFIYQEKYENLYSLYFSRVVQYTNSFLKDIEEANNITNDTFLTLWEHKDKINWDDNVTSWIFLVAKNKCLNVLKKRIHKGNYNNNTIQEKKEYLNYLAIQSDAPANIYQKELEVLLEKAMNKMSPKVRDTFLESRINGLKYSEIAQNNKISNRTVEARIKLAMLILRKTFKDYL